MWFWEPRFNSDSMTPNQLYTSHWISCQKALQSVLISTLTYLHALYSSTHAHWVGVSMCLGLEWVDDPLLLLLLLEHYVIRVSPWVRHFQNLGPIIVEKQRIQVSFIGFVVVCTLAHHTPSKLQNAFKAHFNAKVLNFLIFSLSLSRSLRWLLREWRWKTVLATIISAFFNSFETYDPNKKWRFSHIACRFVCVCVSFCVQTSCFHWILCVCVCVTHWSTFASHNAKNVPLAKECRLYGPSNWSRCLHAQHNALWKNSKTPPCSNMYARSHNGIVSSIGNGQRSSKLILHLYRCDSMRRCLFPLQDGFRIIFT